MRAFVILLIAASALLISGEAAITNSEISQLVVRGVEHPKRIDGYRRSLRVAEDENDEERSWSMIKGIPRSKAETVDQWLTPQLQQRMNVPAFAKDVGITTRTAAMEHGNWNALVKYLKMYHHAVTGEKMSKSWAESVLLNDVLTAKNGFHTMGTS